MQKSRTGTEQLPLRAARGELGAKADPVRTDAQTQSQDETVVGTEMAGTGPHLMYPSGPLPENRVALAMTESVLRFLSKAFALRRYAT